MCCPISGRDHDIPPDHPISGHWCLDVHHRRQQHGHDDHPNEDEIAAIAMSICLIIVVIETIKIFATKKSWIL